MKHNYLKLALLMVLCAVSLKGYAQTVDEVSLVTSAVGSTKDGATKNALMHAIELVYGTFVSANTDVLVDDAVKNEITASTNGSIKSHEEIFSIEMPNGKHLTTLRATVAIPKLTNYAQSKGFQTELAGATFGTALKERNMYAQNEVNVMNTLFEQLELLAPTIYDHDLKVSDPTTTYNGTSVGATIRVLSNSNTKKFYDALVGTLKALSMSAKMIEENKQCGFESYGYNIFLLSAPKDLKEYSCTLYSLPNEREKSTEHIYWFYTNFGDTKFDKLMEKTLYSFDIIDNKGIIYPIETIHPASSLNSKNAFDIYTGTYTDAVRVCVENTGSSNICAGIKQGMYKAKYSNCLGQLVFQCDVPGVVQYEMKHTLKVPTSLISEITGFKIDRGKAIASDNVFEKPIFLTNNDFNKWIHRNLHLSEESMNSVTGVSSFDIQYVVDVDGNVTGVLVRDAAHGNIDKLAKEIAATIASSPKWTPGKDKNGNAVKVLFNTRFAVFVEDVIEMRKNSSNMTNGTNNSGETVPYQSVDEKPSFQGGDANAFTSWVYKNLVYPEEAKRKGITGRVTLQFTIDTDGSVTDVKVLRGEDPDLDKEAVRVVSMSPKWTPGKVKGKPVRVTFTFPVAFR